MAGETPITIVGNLVDEPELRYTPSGAAVCKFRVASTPRIFDANSKEWRDGDTLFMRCTVWKNVAENLAESDLKKGTRVIVVGTLHQQNYETKEGEKRTSYEMRVDEVGPSVKYAKTAVTKATSSGGASGGAKSKPAADADPWATSGGGNFSDEPPF